MFNINIQNKINQELKILTHLIKQNVVINQGFAQKANEHRLFSDIEIYSEQLLIKTLETNLSKFCFLKKIAKNSGSSKAPYDLLLKFIINNTNFDIYLDLKPINIAKPASSPFMGSIRKYIQRLRDEKYYDLYMIIFYKSEQNKLPIFCKLDYFFVKDIKNFSLYYNWQLQLTIKHSLPTYGISYHYGRSSDDFKSSMNNLLDNYYGEGITKIKASIQKLRDLLNS